VKTFALIIAAFASLQSFAQAMPIQRGLYEGSGNYRGDEGETGSYRIASQFTDKTVGGRSVISMVTKSNIGGGWEIYFADQRNGFFKILDSYMKQIGEGYCFDFQCHISTVSLLTRTEETYTFQGPALYVLGIRTQNGKKSMWQEVLHRR
jgi:hypothetical protein